ncbi:MAG: SRPBCC domain-containing protein [Flavobacteriales bacterium]|jgi:uncharacterized protein YndB with AHSA1/START domain/effector-binding domain-containing protein|nr:SRPBCC domain-containing protein [Flavobacteriales bacterium]
MSTATRITVSTFVNKPVDHVWKVWSEPEHIMQWCAASDDWHCPQATNDLRTGGAFSSTMAARDGSASFAFSGTYDDVQLHKRIAYTMEDGRTCEVRFTEEKSGTRVVETFDAETQNSVEMQQGGWQAILDRFKKHAEKPSEPPGFGVQQLIGTPEVIRTKEMPTAVIHLKIPGKDMPKYIDPAVKEILKTLSEQGLQPVGPMFSYHHCRPSDTFDFELGFPVSKRIKEVGRVVNGVLPAEKVARSVYQGPYEKLASAWGELQAWVKGQGVSDSGRFWECYLNNPAEVKDPKEYRTELNWVVEG